MPSQAKKEGNARHVAKLDLIKIQPYKDEGGEIRAAAADLGFSVQAYVLAAVRERMERDAAELARIRQERAEQEERERLEMERNSLSLDIEDYI